jgi:hypothetical protein
VSQNLIPISDEQAKLGQEILKTLREAGSFLEKTLGSTPEDLVAYLGGDWLRVRRAENLVRLFQEAMARLADRHVQDPIPASLSVALPILQGAADEDRDELVDLWARLLANAMDPKLNSVRQSFINAVKRMDPLDASVLRYICEAKIDSVVPGHAGEPNQKNTGVGKISVATGRRNDDVEVSLRHLQDLSLLEEMPGRARNTGWQVNPNGREFLRACYPELETE